MPECSVCRPTEPSADLWFDRHLPWFTRRCQYHFRHLPAEQREEASAEVLASIIQYVRRAAARDKLPCLTPATLFQFFLRLYRAGRRMAGQRATDVMSEGYGRRGQHRVFSLSEFSPVRGIDANAPIRLGEVLSDSREQSPLENARQNLDYDAILDSEHVGTKGRQVFRFLGETLGAGKQLELARELGVSPGRITQLKSELAVALARHGYGLE